MITFDKLTTRFQYVSLQLSAFRSPITANSVRDILNSLPKDLKATYDRVFLRLGRNHRRLAIRALTWVAYSQVPLSIEQLAIAVLIDLNTDSEVPPEAEESVTEADYLTSFFHQGDKFSNPFDVLYLLPGLLNVQSWTNLGELENLKNQIDKSDRVVMTHFSLLEYLTSKTIKKRAVADFALNRSLAQKQIAVACLRYHISFSQNEIAEVGNEHLEDYAFRQYAARHGLRHAENVGQLSWPASLRRLIRCILLPKSNAFAKLKQLSGYSRRRQNEPPLHYATGMRLPETMTFLLQQNLADVNTDGDSLVSTAINHACAIDYIEGMNILLDAGADVYLGNENFLCTLDVAIRFERDEAVDLLLKIPDIIPRCQEIGYWPLIEVVRDGTSGDECDEDHVFNKLIMHGADPNAYPPGKLPPLHTAVAWRQQNSLGSLIGNGADVHARDPYFGNALQCALALAFSAGISRLQEAGARMDKMDSDWKCLLQRMSEGDFFKTSRSGPVAASRLELAQDLLRKGNHGGINTKLFIDWIEGPVRIDIREGLLPGYRVITDIPEWYLASDSSSGTDVPRSSLLPVSRRQSDIDDLE
jgi:ankyrin repeat protein